MNVRNIRAIVFMGLSVTSGHLIASKSEAPSKKSALKRHYKAVAVLLDKLEQRLPSDLLSVGSPVRSSWDDIYAMINQGLVSPRSHKKLEKMQHAVDDARSSVMIISRMRYEQRRQKKSVAVVGNPIAVMRALQEAVQHHLRVVEKIHRTLAQEPCKSLSCRVNRDALTRLSEVVQSVLEEALDVIQKAERVMVD